MTDSSFLERVLGKVTCGNCKLMKHKSVKPKRVGCIAGEVKNGLHNDQGWIITTSMLIPKKWDKARTCSLFLANDLREEGE